MLYNSWGEDEIVPLCIWDFIRMQKRMIFLRMMKVTKNGVNKCYLVYLEKMKRQQN